MTGGCLESGVVWSVFVSVDKETCVVGVSGVEVVFFR